MRERGERPANPVPPKEPEAQSQVAAPIDWWKLDDYGRAETLGILLRFVPELVRRYALQDSEVPPCWHKHDTLIQELLALYQYRNQQQFLPVAPPSAPLDFHYNLQLAIGRLTGWTARHGCRTGEHTPANLAAWVDPESEKSSEWIVTAEEDIAMRTGYELELVDPPGRPRQYRVVEQDIDNEEDA